MTDDDKPNLRIAGPGDESPPPRARVVPLHNITRLDIPPERVLQMAIEAGLEGVLVVGYTKDGQEYAACSYADGGMALWLLERTKTKLLAVPDSELFT